MLISEVSNALKSASADGVTHLLNRRLRVDIPNIHRPVRRLREGEARRSRSITSSPIRVRERLGERRERREAHAERRETSLCLLDDSLSMSGSGCLGLLRLGDIGTTIFAVVDSLACPGWLRRQSCNDLINGETASFELVMRG